MAPCCLLNNDLYFLPRHLDIIIYMDPDTTQIITRENSNKSQQSIFCVKIPLSIWSYLWDKLFNLTWISFQSLWSSTQLFWLWWKLSQDRCDDRNSSFKFARTDQTEVRLQWSWCLARISPPCQPLLDRASPGPQPDGLLLEKVAGNLIHVLGVGHYSHCLIVITRDCHWHPRCFTLPS